MTDQAQAQAHDQNLDEAPEVAPTDTNSALIFRIVLANGVVYQIGEEWPDPSGEADDTAKYTATDEKGESVEGRLKIGAIFARPEEAITTEETDEDGITATRTVTVSAGYDVWSEPCSPKMRKVRVPESNVVYDESTVPFKYAADEIQERMLESVVEFPEDETPSDAPSTAATTTASPAAPSPTSPAASAE